MIKRQDKCPECGARIEHEDIDTAIEVAEQNPDEFCEWIEFRCPNCDSELRCRAGLVVEIELDYANPDTY